MRDRSAHLARRSLELDARACHRAPASRSRARASAPFLPLRAREFTLQFTAHTLDTVANCTYSINNCGNTNKNGRPRQVQKERGGYITS